tara:strand:- start:5228 stop:5413 length:186 start_codon:yes stop_codon:yes gene_type:complete
MNQKLESDVIYNFSYIGLSGSKRRSCGVYSDSLRAIIINNLLFIGIDRCFDIKDRVKECKL